MAGLILKLKPHEEIIVNGVVIENGDRQTKLRIRSENANVLRRRDAISPEDATTPLAQAYYAAQLAVCGDLNATDARAVALLALKRAAREPSASGAATNGGPASVGAAIRTALTELEAGRFYQVMKALAGHIRSGETADDPAREARNEDCAAPPTSAGAKAA